MAALGNASYSSTYESLPGSTATTTNTVPWSPFAIGVVVGPPYDDGSGLPGAIAAPAAQTTGQTWPRGAGEG